MADIFEILLEEQKSHLSDWQIKTNTREMVVLTGKYCEEIKKHDIVQEGNGHA